MEESTESVIGVSPLSIIVGGMTCSGKTTIAQIITEALEARGFMVTLKDEEHLRFSQDEIALRSNALIEKGCPIKVTTLQLGRAGVNAIGNLDKRQNVQSNIITLKH